MHNDILRKAIGQYQYRSHGFAILGRKTFWKYQINKKVLHGLLISLFRKVFTNVYLFNAPR